MVLRLNRGRSIFASLTIYRDTQEMKGISYSTTEELLSGRQESVRIECVDFHVMEMRQAVE